MRAYVPWLAASLVLGSPFAVLADDGSRVLYLGADDGVAAALRIQLVTTAAVDVRDVELPPRLLDAIATAEETRRRAGVALVVWVERAVEPDGSQLVVMHAVGRRAGTMLTRVFHARGADEAELDRAVALEAANVLDAIVEARASAGEERALLAAVESDGARAHGRARDGPGLALDVTAAVRAVPASDLVQSLFTARAGATWRHDALTLAVLAGAAWAPGVTRDAPSFGSLVEIEERELRAGVSLDLALTERVSAGATAEGILRLVRAVGTTSDGARGHTEISSGAIALGAEVAVRVVPGLELRPSLGVELSPISERFAVRGENVVDLGSARLFVGLGTRLAIP